MQHSLPHCVHSHSLVPINIQKESMNVNGCHSFLHEGIQFHTFASYALLCQMPLCQIVPLLPSVTRQQSGMGYWWEGSASTAISPTSSFDTVAQHNKIGGTTFRRALKKYTVMYISKKKPTYFNLLYFHLKKETKTKLMGYLTLFL